MMTIGLSATKVSLSDKLVAIVSEVGVIPWHVGYYERKYQAQRLSDVRQVHRVQGNPGILLKIDKGALPSSDELLLPSPIWFSDELISRIKQVSELISSVG